MFNQIKGVVFLVFSAMFAFAVNAETVNLRSLDGNTSLSGDLVDFDGQVYTIQTIVGTLEVDALQVSCDGLGCPEVVEEAGEFTIAGSSTVINSMIEELLIDFGASLGGGATTNIADSGETSITLENELGASLADVTLSPVGSQQAIDQMIQGGAVIAVATRPASASEISAAAIVGINDLTSLDNQKIIGLDGLVIVIARNNPIRTLAEEDLPRIFSGQITNWSQLGGPNAPINLYVREAASGTAQVFNQLVMAPARAQVSPRATIISSDSDLSAAVANDPLGVGVTGFVDLGDTKAVNIRGVCGIQVPPTAFTIKTEEYPLTRRIYAYLPDNVPSLVDRFVQHLETPNAQAAVAAAGYVDLGVSYQSNDEQGLRYLSAIMPTDVDVNLPQLRRMTGDLLGSDRMSITFRFALGSSQLDPRAQADIQRLASTLALSELASKEVLLIGFTDSIGSATSNYALSERRAREVLDALYGAAPAGSLDGINIQAFGYGEISPLSCNESDNGRQINRRVEVWIRDVVSRSQ